MSKLIPALVLVFLIGLLPVFVVIGVRALLKYDSFDEMKRGDH